MLNRSVTYLHLQPDGVLPEGIAEHSFKAILIVESDVSQLWQWELSRWLVSCGCRSVLAWGKDCSAWADAVDEANLERFDYAEIPDEESVTTTWHEDEELEEVFWFAKHRAKHPVLELGTTMLIHIAEGEKRNEIEALYADA